MNPAFLQSWNVSRAVSYALADVNVFVQDVLDGIVVAIHSEYPCLNALRVDAEWIPKNHALKLKAPKVTEPPTLPLTRDEVVRILAACQVYPDRLNRVRLKALVLLLRYSGLRIRDVVTLSRDRIAKDKPFLSTMKTGTVV